MCSRRHDRDMRRIMRELEALSIYERCFQPCRPPPCASPSPTPAPPVAVPVDAGASSEATTSSNAPPSSGFHTIAPDPRRRARLEQGLQRQEAIDAEREAARQAARYEVTPGGNALGGSSHGLTSTEIRRQRVEAMRRRPSQPTHARSLSLPSNVNGSAASGHGDTGADNEPIPLDPVVARLAERFGEDEAVYALCCTDSEEEEATQLLEASLEDIRGYLDKERQDVYQAYRFFLHMLWEAPDALTRGRRLLNTLLHAARNARRDPAKCRIRVGNPALQAKVLWTPVGDELLRWLGFTLSEQDGAYTLSKEDRTSYLMNWRVQLLQGTLACLAESPLLLQAFLEDEAAARTEEQAAAAFFAGTTGGGGAGPRRGRARSVGGGVGAIASEEDEDEENDGMGEPPHAFLCPISMELMADPVVLAETRQTYDRASIDHWFVLGNRTDPLTNLPLESLAMEPDHALSLQIAAWQQARLRRRGGVGGGGLKKKCV